MWVYLPPILPEGKGPEQDPQGGIEGREVEAQRKKLQVKAGVWGMVMTSVSKHWKDPPGTERLGLCDAAPGAKLGRMRVELRKGSHKGDCDQSEALTQGCPP